MDVIQAQILQLTEQMRGLALENERLRMEAVAAQRAAATASNQALAELVGALHEQNRLTAASGRRSVIDSKGIGKPPQYSGKEADFLVWTRKVESFFGAVHEDISFVFEYVLDQTTLVLNGDLDLVFDGSAADRPKVEGLDQKSAQLCLILSQLTDGEAFDIVVNSGKNAGFEAWRRLHRRYDPATGGRRRNMLREIIGPGRCKQDRDLQPAIERWEDLVVRYERKAGKSLDDDLKMAALEAMAPTELERHLLLNTARLTTYSAMREEVYLYMETRAGIRMKQEHVTHTGAADPNAMDVGSFVGGKAGKGKGKGKSGKGKGKEATQPKKFDGACHNCGKSGHMAKDCWAPKSSLAASSAYGKAAPQKGKGKGKSGKGKKATGSLEDEQPEEEVAGFYLHAFVPVPAQAGQVDTSVVINPVIGKIPEIGAVEWITCNYDTGCARTVVPISEGVTECGQVRTDGTTYRTASGQVLDDRGAIIVPITDENGRRCLMKARCVDVHKTLVSASACSRTQDAWITNDGGWLWPRDGPLGRELAKAVDRIMAKHEYKDTIPIYKERGVYNFYVRRRGKPVADASVVGSPLSGGTRQA